MYKDMHTYVYISIYVSRLYADLPRTGVFLCVCICGWMYKEIYVYICVYICVYTHMYVHCTHIYVHRLASYRRVYVCVNVWVRMCT